MISGKKSGLVFATVLLMLAFMGCDKKPEVAAPPPPEVIVANALEKEVTQFLEFTGTTAAVAFVEVRARVEGWLESIHFDPGAQVKKGDLLFVIDPRPFKAQVDQSEAALKGKESDMQLKEANLKRAQQLLSSASISQLQFDIDSANASVSEAQVGIAKADLEKTKLDLAYTQVIAPVKGRVSRNYVDLGNLVGAKDKTLLTEIVDDSSVFVYFDVSERDLLMLMRKFPKIETEADNERGKPTIYLQLADETGFPHEGKLDFVESRLDPSTGTIRARARFENPNSLLVPGLFSRVRVPIERSQRLLLPELAVGISQGGRYVLVVNKDNIVEQRPVKAGPLEGTFRVIDDGLKKDDLVVVNAIQRARPGAKVNPTKTTLTIPSAAPEKAAQTSAQ